jgi:REP element-mobilizing transposase RayT
MTHSRTPPRLDQLFDATPLYLITFRTHQRRPILANAPVMRAVQAFAEDSIHQAIAVGRFVIMPDHIHLFVRGRRNIQTQFMGWEIETANHAGADRRRRRTPLSRGYRAGIRIWCSCATKGRAETASPNALRDRSACKYPDNNELSESLVDETFCLTIHVGINSRASGICAM